MLKRFAASAQDAGFGDCGWFLNRGCGGRECLGNSYCIGDCLSRRAGSDGPEQEASAKNGHQRVSMKRYH